MKENLWLGLSSRIYGKSIQLYSCLDHDLQQFNNCYQHVDESVELSIGLVDVFFFVEWKIYTFVVIKVI